MSRRRRAEKREILPDPKFGDRVVSKFMNNVMRDGKKSVAERIVYGAFDQISARGGSDAVKVFHDALENVKPQIEVRSRRVGGATYQVPIEVRPDRAQALAFRWLIAAARDQLLTQPVYYLTFHGDLVAGDADSGGTDSGGTHADDSARQTACAS